MKTILLLAPIAALLAGCASGPPQPTTSVARDLRGNLVLEEIGRSDDYHPAAFPPFHYYNPVTQKNDWEKYEAPKINFKK